MQVLTTAGNRTVADAERVALKQVWCGGEWMLNRKGEAIPIMMGVPDPDLEEQFLAHTQVPIFNPDGSRKLHPRSGAPMFRKGVRVDETYGHKTVEEAAEARVKGCPADILELLIKRDLNEIRSDMERRGASPEFIEQKQASREKQIREANARPAPEVTSRKKKDEG